MEEQYKISIKFLNQGLNVEGVDKEWVEGNTKQFLDKLNNRSDEKELKSVFESWLLKRLIGIIILLFVVIAYFFVSKIIIVDVQRLLIAILLGLCGLGLKAFVYDSFLKKAESKRLSGKEVNDCLFAYFLYYPMGVGAVISFIFVAFYENIRNMSFELFLCVSLLLFLSVGFAVYEAMKKFLLAIGEK